MKFCNAISALLIAGAALPQVPNQHHHPPQSADEYASVLEDPSRDDWQKPHEVIMVLKLKPTDVIAGKCCSFGFGKVVP